MKYFEETLFFPDYNLKEIADSACKVVLQAGDIAMEKFQKLATLQIETKNPGDFVSAADKEVEIFLREKLLLAYPNFLVFGEEDGWAAAKGNKQGPVWVVDPIDGTTPFISGLESWCISVSLCIQNIPAIGIIYAPVAKEMYVAYQKGGCFLNDEPLSVHKENMRKFGIGHSNRTTPEAVNIVINKLLHNNIGLYSNGSGALMLAYVAAGRLAGYFEEHLNSWDCAAGIRLVLEAGGKFTEFDRENFIDNGARVFCGYEGTLLQLHEEKK